jgi:protein SCO1/2
VVVTISIDPKETPELARAKRATHLKALGKEGASWHFLVGQEREIQRIAKAVGFGYRYDPTQDQYAHPAVLTFLAPDGKVARYLYGLEYTPMDLRFAVMEASEGRVGSPADKLVLSCFHYDASIGRYGPAAMGIMRIGGAVTLLALGTFLAIYWRRERFVRRLKEAT